MKISIKKKKEKDYLSLETIDEVIKIQISNLKKKKVFFHDIML